MSSYRILVSNTETLTSLSKSIPFNNSKAVLNLYTDTQQSNQSTIFNHDDNTMYSHIPIEFFHDDECVEGVDEGGHVSAECVVQCAPVTVPVHPTRAHTCI
jgi:hypothetical protein